MHRTTVLLLLVATPMAHAGYEQPNFIDGCQSVDGRYVVTATQTESGKKLHGPNAWAFTWKDTKSGETRTYPAKGVQGGQVHAHLYIAPDGKTFALWNHVTMWWPEQSASHASSKLPKKPEPGTETDEWKQQEVFSHRLVIYSSEDGAVLKTLSVADLLQPEEWETVLPVFNRVHWIREYEGTDGRLLRFKQMPRPGYAFHRVSPDYTVLEFRATSSRANRREPPRMVRVNLVSGEVIPKERWPTEKVKVPVQPYVGEDHVPAEGKSNVWKEAFVPSLDPVRQPYRYDLPEDAATPTSLEASDEPHEAVQAITIDPATLKLELLVGGLGKADTPAYDPAEKAWYFTDLEAGEQYRLVDGGKPEVVRREAVRAKAGPDGRLYGVFGGQLAWWRPGHDLQVVAKSAANGRALSLNDIAVSKAHAYFTTLKDPEKGRLSVVDLANGEVNVAFDGEEIGELANPNGVALAPDGRHLYVGISNYKARKHSGVYRFPVREDGSLDVEAGREKPWAAVKAPDGIATTPDGRVWFTAGNTIHVYDPDANSVGKVKIPKGSGTNLAFGGPDGRTLVATTWNALYIATPE